MKKHRHSFRAYLDVLIEDHLYDENYDTIIKLYGFDRQLVGAITIEQVGGNKTPVFKIKYRSRENKLIYQEVSINDSFEKFFDQLFDKELIVMQELSCGKDIFFTTFEEVF